MNDNKSNILEITHGGARPNAGRREGTGKFGEPTSVVRVPVSQEPVIKDFLAAYQHKKLLTDLDVIAEFELPSLSALPVSLPLYSSKVSAGFPSPADDHVETRLDPSEFLIDQKDATFFVTIQGQSMIDVGLLPGDKAVIDRSKDASVGDIVLAIVNGEFTIKILGRHSKTKAPRLLPANSTGAYSPIEITEEMQFEIWGVCTGSFRRFQK
ncbi:LexA family protein [Methylotenera versatilis]|uniref:LexA family protein n=1 Tax=Methylotenera versatilis TaxID=1055487 RepID=UPI0006469AA2|nr:translesion error-prone DNA polymerase V autoproteolytic subunit [Methylotenera versatilis]